ncbi:intermembrane phospholipid transport protein YdbH family protein [Altererythrobacter lauratis]|uniref:YdbH domain-containing protein n=1 Tax=Alteraurantiacibacter lauratis TaxID=2054627 RepID=A0ABV7EEI5_9SPHN
MTPQTASEEPPPMPPTRGNWPRLPWGKALAVFLLMLAVAAGILWSQRKGIADDYIAATLDQMGIEGTYDVESISPEVQVLRNIVIGDPARPDAVIDRAEVRLKATFGLPQISAITLDGVRVWGRIIDGQPSFGTLDPLIFTDSTEPFAFPAIHLTLREGHALIEGDYGPLAASLTGSGRLDDGFAGELAVVAPQLRLAGCAADQATLYGRIVIDDQRPSFAGPLRFARIACAVQGVAVEGGAAQLALRADADMQGVRGDAGLRLGVVGAPSVRFASLTGETRLAYRGGNFNSDFELAAVDLAADAVRLSRLEAEGRLRIFDNFARFELESELDGRNLQPGGQWVAALTEAEAGAAGTLAQPLLAQFRRQLGAQLPGSTLLANLTLRQTAGGQLGLVIPEARLRARGGESLLLLTRAQMGLTPQGVPLFSGNILTGGSGLPQIAGRMEQDAGGALELRLRMAEYAVGTDRLEVPDLVLRQNDDGALTFAGRAIASGALPGGSAERLEVPLTGRVSAAGAVSVWPGCTPVRFAQLQLANLALDGRSVILCPPSGAPILRYDAGGLRLAAGVPALQLTGRLGETPLRLSTGAVGFAFPGVMTARTIAVELGDTIAPTRFTLADLTAQLGDDIAGSFNGTDVRLAAVPLDVRDASGEWRYDAGVLSLVGAAFRLEDRQEIDRFHPLVAQGARLTLADNTITSAFTLRHPATGTAVTEVTLLHRLDNATGSASIAVPGITFGEAIQPRDLSELAYGVVSLVRGTVTGNGRVDWTADAVTSSGAFSSTGLDFAAAFGPVERARGTVVFTDLLGLTTAPAQRLEIGMVNPGIEVDNGVVTFSLTDGTRLALESAEWPFLDGTLSMQPLVMNIGTAEERRYVFQIEGLAAARLIERMELNNLAATGLFDGVLPVVFDAMGNGRLQGGLLSARPPGGHVSYIGQLTYEDLSFVGNFAFQSLRDLNYDRMEVELDGPLTGELVTKVRLDGVRQGATAQTNFLTRRLARLPIRLVVNLRAPFYQMVSSMRSLYDPSSVRDPRGLGLIRSDGRVIRNSVNGADAPPPETPGFPSASPATQSEPAIQPPEREAMP